MRRVLVPVSAAVLGWSQRDSRNESRGDVFAAVHARDVKALRQALGGDLNARNAEGQTPLLIAARAPDGAALVKVLLEEGADVNVGDRLGRTPLHMACLGGDTQTTGLLLRAGAATDAKDTRRGATPLHFAAAFARVDASRMILATDDDLVNSRDFLGRAPLHWSALSAHRDWAQVPSLQVAETLLDNGADARARDNTGATPAHTAARFGAANFLSLLVEKHVDDDKDDDRLSLLGVKRRPRGLLHQIDHRGHSPLDIAIARYEKSRLKGSFLWPGSFLEVDLGIALPRSVLPWTWYQPRSSSSSNSSSKK